MNEICKTAITRLGNCIPDGRVRLDALAQMRPRLLGKFRLSVAASEQIGLEDLRRRSEAEALARRGVQARAELTKFLL